jgi:hypothetical protein
MAASVAAVAEPAVVPLAGQAEGALIDQVDVVLVRGSGNAARDGAVVARLRDRLGGLEGRAYSQALVEGALAEPRQRLGSGHIAYRLANAPARSGLILRVEVDTVGPGPDTPARLAGLLAGGGVESLPTLYRDGRSYLTQILVGGFGAYSDGHAWFGRPDLFAARSPLSRRLPGPRASWTEGYVEAGIGGATQIGDSPYYLYGAMTALTSWSLGQDIYRDDARSLTSIEKAYLGLLYVDPVSGNSFNVSAGRQNVTLNDGWLVHFVRGSANIGARAGTYLGPRNANDFSVVADATVGRWSFKAFYIDPSELPLVDTRSTFAGANLRYAVTPSVSVDASVITVPSSTSTFLKPDGSRLSRAGLRTVAAGLRWKRPFGIDGLWVATEAAHQSHERFAMSAWAAYGLVGYQFNAVPWTPSLSYRYSHASGDNPTTGRYERFDPLLSTGLGNWLQGVTFGKLTSNSNLAVHRIQVNLVPNPRLNLTFDWHVLRAVDLNNRGSNPAIAQLASSDLGQELSLTARWALSRQFYFQGIASIALPGKALRAIGADKPWSTLQASLYWSF